MMTIHDHFIAAAFTGLLAADPKPGPAQTLSGFRRELMSNAIKLGEEMVSQIYESRREGMAQELAEDATTRGLEHANAILSEAEKKLERIQIYTDGACVPNPGYGAWAAIADIGDGHPLVFSGTEHDTTNNRMEIMACIEALKSLRHLDRPAHIHTDSQYVQKGISQWSHKWARHGWQCKNGDLWRTLYRLTYEEDRTVEYSWVRGHDGNHLNEQANNLAEKLVGGHRIDRPS